MPRNPLPTSDLYAVLGVRRAAGADEIRKAYKQQALLYHPDKAGNTPEANEKFKRIAEAYEVLSEESKRRDYDDGQRAASASYTTTTRPAGRPSSSQGAGPRSPEQTRSHEILARFHRYKKQRELPEHMREPLVPLRADAALVLQGHFAERARGLLREVRRLQGVLADAEAKVREVVPATWKVVGEGMRSAHRRVGELQYSVFRQIQILNRLAASEAPAGLRDFFEVADRIDGSLGRLYQEFTLMEQVGGMADQIKDSDASEWSGLVIKLGEVLRFVEDRFVP